jgi:aspartate beta-hydroxylase
LEEHAEAIRDEYLQVSPTIPSDYHDPGGGGGEQQHVSLHQGPTPWKWHSYLSKGHVQGQFVQSFPYTSRVLQQLRSEGILFEGTPFGFAFFSTLGPGSTIAPHTAPMNLRLRIHLSLIVPTITTKSDDDTTTTGTTTSSSGTTTTTTPPPLGDTTTDSTFPTPLGIRVGIHEREWVPSKALVLDDSYQHSVWNHHPSESRVVLLVDIWHPDISGEERTAIVQLFQQARLDGLWKR